MSLARPVPEAVGRAVGAYQRLSGIHVRPSNIGEATVAPEATRRVAQAYDRLPAFDSRAVPAFNAMREEVGRQFDHLTRPQSKGGLGMDVEVTHEDPYKVDAGNGRRGMGEMFDDVANGHMKVLSTAATGGHPFFSNDENDMFRAVHDVFGHVGSGRGVDPHGEEAAYQKHASMFSPLARRALAAETRGQNSSMNNAGGVFPEQKVALLPEPLTARTTMAPRDAATRGATRLQASQFARQQGLG